MATAFNLFVYGSLRRGESAHHLIERGVLEVRPGRVAATLDYLPEGYAILDLSPGSALAEASPDSAADAALASPSATVPAPPANAESPTVEGELLTLDSADWLPKLDEYEESTPGAAGLYRRVLVRVEASPPALAWTYARP